MAWVVHSAWLERHFDGTDVQDLDVIGAHADIKMGIVTEAAINPDTNSLYSGLTAVATATAWTGPVAINNATCGLTAGNLIFDMDDPAVIAQDAGGFTNGRTLVIYESTTSYIIASYIHTAAFSLVSGSVTITLDATGVWTLTI